ncbi:MAG: disulfide bond formation protein B [Bauldia sp.]
MKVSRESWLFAAWIIAFAATMSALFIGEVLGQAPCTLCWFQRACMFPLAIILGIAAYRSDASAWRYGLPLALLGGAVALYHSLLYADVISEPPLPCQASGPSCSGAEMLIFGSVPIPYLALVAFVAIAVALWRVRTVE